VQAIHACTRPFLELSFFIDKEAGAIGRHEKDPLACHPERRKESPACRIEPEAAKDPSQRSG